MLSAGELDRAQLEGLLDRALAYREGRGRRHVDALVALAFFEESLRTRVGYEAAAARLGARTVSVLSPKRTALMGAAETAGDALRSIGGWVDAVCVRHEDAAVARQAAEALRAPVINCGNGREEHPSQAVVDLLTLQVVRGGIDGLRIGMVGDLHGMRTTHSLVLALARFDDVTVRMVCPPGLELPPRYSEPFVRAGHALEVASDLELEDLDVVYVAGLPAPTAIGELTDGVQARYRLTEEVVASLRPETRILCPLPRVDEIAPGVDGTARAAYFLQSELSVWARMAVLDDVLTQPAH